MKYGKQDYEVIGHLEGGLRNIKVGKGDFLYFWLTPLSDFPNSTTEDIEKIQIYATELKKYDFKDEGYFEEERVEYLSEFLKDFLIICTPTITSNEDDGRIFCRGDDVRLVRKNEADAEKGTRYTPLPVFNKSTLSSIESKEAFEKAFFEEKLVGKLLKYSKDSNDYPFSVMWYEDENNYRLYGKVIGQNYSQYGVQYNVDKDDEYYIDFTYSKDQDWFDFGHFNEEETIYFIPSEILLNKVEASKKVLSLTTMDNGTTELLDDAVESLSTQFNNDIDNKKNNSNPSDNNVEEKHFIERLKEVAQKHYNLHYEEKDLINFHTAIKGDSLIILSGLSGTGKSQLVHTYAKALSIGEEQLQFISVRPFWEDDSDLLGYVDNVNSIYRPGDSGLLDVLIRASKNPENLYMICFDEMNLARVEHYFSQFLSVLELEPENRKLKLYNPELERRLYNSSEYPAELKIGPNLIFIGTINTDESTHQFSDKVLDRSNLISLELVPFASVSHGVISDTSNKPNVGKAMKFDKFKSLKKSSPDNVLTVAEKEMFWEIHLQMNAYDKNIGIGWRVLNQIEGYLQNLPQNSKLTRAEALDYQLSQRVLTKIRGTEEQLSNILGIWNKTNDSYEKGSLEKILDENSESSNFNISRKIIHQKSKEIGLHGFTI